MSVLFLLWHLVGRLAGLPVQRLTSFLDDAEEVWAFDPLLTDDDLGPVG